MGGCGETGQRYARTIEPPALYRWTFNFMVLPDGSESLGGMVVGTNYFRTLGVRPLLGRELTDEEAAACSGPSHSATDTNHVPGMPAEFQVLLRSVRAAGHGVSGTGVSGLPSRNQLVRLSTTS